MGVDQPQQERIGAGRVRCLLQCVLEDAGGIGAASHEEEVEAAGDDHLAARSEVGGGGVQRSLVEPLADLPEAGLLVEGGGAREGLEVVRTLAERAAGRGEGGEVGRHGLEDARELGALQVARDPEDLVAPWVQEERGGVDDDLVPRIESLVARAHQDRHVAAGQIDDHRVLEHVLLHEIAIAQPRLVQRPRDAAARAAAALGGTRNGRPSAIGTPEMHEQGRPALFRLREGARVVLRPRDLRPLAGGGGEDETREHRASRRNGPGGWRPPGPEAAPVARSSSGLRGWSGAARRPPPGPRRRRGWSRRARW